MGLGQVVSSWVGSGGVGWRSWNGWKQVFNNVLDQSQESHGVGGQTLQDRGAVVRSGDEHGPAGTSVASMEKTDRSM